MVNLRIISYRNALFHGVGIVRMYCSNQSKIANLGLITEYLKDDGIPNLLQKNFNNKFIDNEIKLRVKTVDQNNLLFKEYSIQGKKKYNISMKMIRLILNKFIIDKNCHFHVMSVKSILNDDNLDSNRNDFVTDNDKLIIKWHSCLPNEGRCKYDTEELNKKSLLKQNILEKIFSEKTYNSNNSYEDEIEDIRNTSTANEVNISGKFIFEFNDNNDKIIVHTIENIEMIDYRNIKRVLSFA
ncbi:hypothetical protein Kpol_543p33 [Vanderwaltozyma polyspora DSM 70294]|uniref:Uncharacterized protein n=1 Tax=Vanderwaltozyma polyspora (strain ATCC 22028 / DSM 70294 / BCRC 21397 / CBS 2163 / NBRC 10782 / NRRL Y-8283 / UCD 57-17) TaxID=436907 RepID=A7THN7_VANPO|nr:uncharacterized protein Kpol_543p33 [Vanderwaltozyma polyspora DSM 70294]EDO18203.1 hypothetical protein Kpol_543p33 [Vanderwaltozyma polyspora DSM 70294]